MTALLGTLGLQAAGSAVSTGINSLFGIDKYNDERQVAQQQKLTDIQTEANEQLMNESYALQQKMFDYTYNKNTASAQVAELKKAGLNPALAYGLSGTGGGTTAGSGGASVGGSQAADASATAKNNIENMNEKTEESKAPEGASTDTTN